MTTRWFSYALKAKLPESLCLIIIGTEGDEPHVLVGGLNSAGTGPALA
jgi:hypothetical protein